eukprot:3040127-Prymnesium_polylepis.1
MMVDELRQLGLVARRCSASSWVDCRHEAGNTNARCRDPVEIAYLARAGSSQSRTTEHTV